MRKYPLILLSNKTICPPQLGRVLLYLYRADSMFDFSNLCSGIAQKARSIERTSYCYTLSVELLSGLRCPAVELLSGLRCPEKSSGLRCSSIFPTAAHQWACCICRRQRSPIGPNFHWLRQFKSVAANKKNSRPEWVDCYFWSC